MRYSCSCGGITEYVNVYSTRRPTTHVYEVGGKRCRWLQDPRKENSPIFWFSFAPPPSCFPGLTRGWPDDGSKQALRIKKSSWLQFLAGFTRKKASTRRVNRKIADSTRNQRVFFSRYLAANYASVLSGRAMLRRGAGWPLQDIVTTNIVWCMAYKGEVEGGSYTAR